MYIYTSRLIFVFFLIFHPVLVYNISEKIKWLKSLNKMIVWSKKEKGSTHLNRKGKKKSDLKNVLVRYGF